MLLGVLALTIAPVIAAFYHDPDLFGGSRAVNAEAPLVMAEEAKKIGAGLIHYSTDHVFDG